MAIDTVPPLIGAQLNYLVTHSPLSIKVEQMWSGSKNHSLLDRFTLAIPFCLDYIRWDVIYNALYPLAAPDIIFGPDDEGFRPFPPAAEDGDLKSPKNSLSDWNCKDPTRLLSLILELRELYMTYQRKRVGEVDDERVKFEISTIVPRERDKQNCTLLDSARAADGGSSRQTDKPDANADQASTPSGAVIAMVSPVQSDPLAAPIPRPTKRSRSDDSSKDLVAELSTKQLTEAPTTTPVWRPNLFHRGKVITEADSIKHDDEHLLGFSLTRSVCLPQDMAGYDDVPDGRVLKSAIHSMTEALQKTHVSWARMGKMKHDLKEGQAKYKDLETELFANHAALEEAQKKLAASEAELKTAIEKAEVAEKAMDEALVELEKTKAKMAEVEMNKATELQEAEDKGFDEAEVSYSKQVEAAKDIFFQSGWKAAVEKVGPGLDSESFNSPPPFYLPEYMWEYATKIISTLVPPSDEEGEGGDPPEA